MKAILIHIWLVILFLFNLRLYIVHRIHCTMYTYVSIAENMYFDSKNVFIPINRINPVLSPKL